MTYLLTDEEHKAVREALNWCIPDDDAVITHHEALAILDKLQRVEVVGYQLSVGTDKSNYHNTWNSKFEADDHKWRGGHARELYAVKE